MSPLRVAAAGGDGRRWLGGGTVVAELLSPDDCSASPLVFTWIAGQRLQLPSLYDFV